MVQVLRDFNKDQIRKLQSIEIAVFRMILGARRYTAEGIRGEMDASLFETKIIKKQSFVLTKQNSKEEGIWWKK